MTIKAELEAQILRYYHVEKWRCGTIARQLHVHRGTVQRVLAQAGLPRLGAVQRPSRIDPYLAFIHETLSLYVPGGDLKAQLINAKIRTPGVSGREPTYTTAYIELIFTFYRLFGWGMRQITGYMEDYWETWTSRCPAPVSWANGSLHWR
ncbi:hypothetical protein AWV80_34070 [Cupriavidus sp. UYMU48A]|nr:hypothetical protein AWV80_34070 [Cupriavidus sp. UYMU48A]